MNEYGEPEEIERCLNCTMEKCSGNYPTCLNPPRPKKEYVPKTKYRQKKLRCLEHGEAVILIGLLAKLGKNRKEIADICETQCQDIRSLLKLAVRKGLITQEQMVATRIRTYNGRCKPEDL